MKIFYLILVAALSCGACATNHEPMAIDTVSVNPALTYENFLDNENQNFIEDPADISYTTQIFPIPIHKPDMSKVVPMPILEIDSSIHHHILRADIETTRLNNYLELRDSISIK